MTEGVLLTDFRQATERDPYMAVAYFQCGVSNFLIGNYEEATRDFEDAETVSPTWPTAG